MLVLLMACAWILPRILRYPKKHYGIVNVMVIFTNIGFMGVPMIDGIYGKDALIYMTVLLIPFNILFFSYVIQTIKGSSDKKGPFVGRVWPIPAWAPWRRRRGTLSPCWRPFTIKMSIPSPFRVLP